MSKEQGRKMKEGRKGRTKDGRIHMKVWVEEYNEAFGNNSVMGQVVEKLGKL